MPRPLIIWGASGHAKVLAEFAADLGYEVVALFDNDRQVASPLPGVPVFHGLAGFLSWRQRSEHRELAGLAAIGSPGSARLEIQDLFLEHGIEVVQAVHPRAFVARSAQMGKGCQIMAQAAVCADARLGDQCIVNTAASADHECVLGAGVHLAPGVRLAGLVRVGAGTFVGAGAVVLPRLSIGEDSLIGAGSVVTRDVPANVVVCGCPARIVRSHQS